MIRTLHRSRCDVFALHFGIYTEGKLAESRHERSYRAERRSASFGYSPASAQSVNWPCWASEMKAGRAGSGLASSRTNASHGSRSSVRRMNPHNTRSGNPNKSRLRNRRNRPRQVCRTAFHHRCCMKRIRFGRMDSCDIAIGFDSCRKFRLPAVLILASLHFSWQGN